MQKRKEFKYTQKAKNAMKARNANITQRNYKQKDYTKKEC